MEEMTMKDLSKKAKYVYRIYCAKDDVVHIEKYPVIYVNQKYLYYKVPGNVMLSFTLLSRIYENVDSINIGHYPGGTHCIDVLVWNPDGVDQIKVSELHRRLNIKANEERIKREETYVENFRRRYEEHVMGPRA